MLRAMTEGERAVLFDGDWSDAAAFMNLALDDGAGARRLWERTRGELLPEWIREHPGTRPHIWWEVDAPRGTDADDPTMGILRRMCDPRRRKRPRGQGTAVFASNFGLPFDVAKDDPGYETEREYLTRHKLLTEQE
jgi:hypothetical protein